MKCSIQGCPGQYEQRTIVHAVQKGDDVFVFEHVPAEVCTVCQDTVFAPETIRRLEGMLREKHQPDKMVPLYDLA